MTSQNQSLVMHAFHDMVLPERSRTRRLNIAFYIANYVYRDVFKYMFQIHGQLSKCRQRQASNLLSNMNKKYFLEDENRERGTNSLANYKSFQYIIMQYTHHDQYYHHHHHIILVIHQRSFVFHDAHQKKKNKMIKNLLNMMLCSFFFTQKSHSSKE